jgi:Bacterial SH3 domain
MRTPLLSFLLLLAFSLTFFLDTQAQESATTSDEGSGKSFFITGTDVRLRSDPGTNSEVLGLMEYGTPVKLLEVSTYEETVGVLKDRWYRVELSEGVTFHEDENMTTIEGWVFGAFLNGFENEQEFRESNASHSGLGQAPSSSLYRRFASHSWNSADNLTYVPCASNSLGADLHTLTFYYYDTYVNTWRVISAIEKGNELRIEAALLSGFGELTNYESVPFPVKKETILIRFSDDFLSLEVAQGEGKESETFYNLQSPFIGQITGTNVQYRQFHQTYEFGNNFDGDYKEYPVVGKWAQGDLIDLLERGGTSNTINGKTGDWLLVKPFLAKVDSGYLTFEPYVKPAGPELMNRLPAQEIGGDEWKILSSKIWIADSEVGKCSITPHGNYLTFKIGAGTEFYFYPTSWYAHNPDRLHGLRLSWAADGTQYASHMSLQFSSTGDQIHLTELPLIHEATFHGQ